MRILFLSLEFAASTFSGNGIYAQSQVRALRGNGHEVLVISGRPQSSETDQATIGTGIIEVPVSKWGKLDASAPYEEYASRGSTQSVIRAIEEFKPEVAMMVDWSSLNLCEALALAGTKLIYLNYRVFSRTAAGKDLELVRSLEKRAMATAALTIVLSRSDMAFLRESLSFEGEIEVLLPALREDMRALPSPTFTSVSSFIESRPYFTCCVRLSPEKSPEVFVSIVEALGEEGVAELGVTPLLVGSAQDVWATELKSRLKKAVPSSIIVESFLGPAELADIYSKTRLNFHPPIYDAYGMTIIEASSQGAPTLAHDGSGAIGATDLLLAHSDEIILTNLTVDEGSCPSKSLIDQIKTTLSNHQRLSQVAMKGMLKARSWNEAANAEKLTHLINSSNIHVC